MRLLLAAAALGAATGFAQDLYYAEDSKRWGTPRRVLPPAYPKEALDKRHTGYVDMEGVVTPFTTLDVQRYIPDSEASRVFIEPLKEAVKYWTFYSALGRDCQPTGEKTVTRVWFELDGDKPRISVSTQHGRAVNVPELTPLERVDPTYPEAAQRSGAQAYVYARMSVDREGRVTEVASVPYPGGVDTRVLVRSTDSALRRWRYPPGDRDVRVVCMEVIYRLR